ncbi:MAG: Asp-tRNA(Asn)/Glu-tRNA(Gln) amidotransferase GatCAB subunit B, partial [Bacteroidota bacterium]
AATTLFDAMIDDPAEPEELAQTLNLIQVSDAGALVPAVEAALASSPEKVAAYRAGKKGLIGFFMGQVMRAYDGSPDPKLVRTLLAERLDQN